mgnify:CR=1 FL=1
MLNGSFSRRVRSAPEPHSPNSNKPFNTGEIMPVKVGDLVKLHSSLKDFTSPGAGFMQQDNVGLVLSVSGETLPRSIVVLWNGEKEPHEEYEDGLEVV